MAARAAEGERRLRLFVALELPDEVRAALATAGAQAASPSWRAVAPESLHITLAFLGSRAAGDVAPIAALLERESPTPAPRLTLADLLALPPRRPRALAVTLADEQGTLVELQARVAAALAAAGLFAPESRPYRPHVTIARARAGATQDAPTTASEAPSGAFTAPSLTLFQSLLERGGARYVCITRTQLTRSL